MLLIPAIDLQNNKCVRLKQGRFGDTTVFSDDPVSVAAKWLELGAKRLHIIDLDGAKKGEPQHYRMVERIAKRVEGMPIQVGGGIRTGDAIQRYLDCGVQYTILGTSAASQPHFVKEVCLEFPGHIIIGLDVRDGKVATDGWSKMSQHDPVDLMQHFEADGISAVLHTDIKRDGMMCGPNFESSTTLARELRVPMIIAGGFASLDDIRQLCEIKEERLQAAVLGRALYEGAIDFSEALKIVKQMYPSG